MAEILQTAEEGYYGGETHLHLAMMKQWREQDQRGTLSPLRLRELS